MENSGRRVMYRKITPRPVFASANVYDRFACAPRPALGRDELMDGGCVRHRLHPARRGHSTRRSTLRLAVLRIVIDELTGK